MPILSRVIFEMIGWRARRGLTEEDANAEAAKEDALQRSVCGETFAYWYLQQKGYVLVARTARLI